MQLEYRVAPLAKRDIDEIWDYVARDDPEAANRLVDNFRSRFILISQNKLIGSARSEFGSGIRLFPFETSLIFYVPYESSVDIVRVLHSARDLTQIFDNDLLN